MVKSKTPSDILKSVTNIGSSDFMTLFEVKTALHERGFAFLMLLFALPLSIPIPVPPGFTTVLSIPLLIFSIQLMLGMDSPWLPKWLEKKSIKRKTLASVIEKTAPILRKIEKLTKRRLPIFNNIIGEKLFAVISLVCSISIAIPLPLTNFIPAQAIGLMSLSILNQDGIIGIAGIIWGIIGLIISAMVVIVGPTIVMEIISKFL
ncbi:MAG: exopolysaccharide biosynthesis protein [Rickettsiaceae bacterium H1]|nr:exopolysaccharide biosynthesis protein [Rickettsiaceae bacterium H1]